MLRRIILIFGLSTRRMVHPSMLAPELTMPVSLILSTREARSALHGMGCCTSLASPAGGVRVSR